jgi:hypothetical protein
MLSLSNPRSTKKQKFYFSVWNLRCISLRQFPKSSCRSKLATWVETCVEKICKISIKIPSSNSIPKSGNLLQILL